MTDAARLSPVVARVEPPNETARMLRRLGRSRNIMIGGIVLLVVIVLCTLAPVLSHYDPLLVTASIRLQPPSLTHLFGTDDFGRDVFTRVLYGGRLSLIVGIVAVALSSVLGTTLGVVAGFYGGKVDTVIMRFMDVMLAFPGILLALAIVAVLGRSLPNVMIAVGLSSIPFYTRVVRGSTLTVKQIDYILAARAIGAPTWALMFRHILPNILSSVIVITTNGVAGAIIAGAALSFLGLGAQAPTPEWGIMLSLGRPFLRQASWVTTFPGLAIMFTVVAINLLGDGLRDVLDPRLKI